MIVVKLKGGLGNQMFQYAAARRLAMRHGTELMLDLSWLSNSPVDATPRSFELGNFNITAKFAETVHVSGQTVSLKPFGKNWFSQLLVKHPPQESTLKVLHESHFQFDVALLAAPDHVCLDGYWQSERYFLDEADAIRQDFTLKRKLDERNGLFAEAINKVQAVSVHVRRGDYVNNPSVSSFHGTCSTAYYRTAMEMVGQQFPNPHFFVFSDDIQWCREHINSSHQMTFVDSNNLENACMDLQLMSLCRHHVIANSSFSWWGAWLNPRPDKLVIAPMRWFNDSMIDTSDLTPASWLRIPE